MDSLNIDELRRIIHNWASKLPHKPRVYLIGSRAKGTARSDSDVDIVLEFLDCHPLELWGNSEKWKQHLSRLIDLKVHLELYEGDESPTVKQALNDASVILYDPVGP